MDPDATLEGLLRKDPIVDPIVGGWTDADIVKRFRLDGTRGWGNTYADPSIVAETRAGVKGFRVSDLRTGGSSLRVGRKLTATRIAKLIDQDRYGR